MPATYIPAPGLGTWQNHGEKVIESVRTAVEIGYRHIDTAQFYGNEAAIGEAVERVDVDREDLLLATKPHWEHHSYEEVITRVEASVDRLGVEYVDLLYVHWPAYDYDPEETFAAFAELVDRGLVTHVGVANFTIDLLEEALDAADVPIVANQIETHPYYQQAEMHEFLVDHDLYHVAYAPLGQGHALDVPEIVEIAERYDATPAQICLAWLLGRENVVPIPMADTEAHARENWNAREIELDAEDVATIEEIDREEKYVDPGHAPWNDGEGSLG